MSFAFAIFLPRVRFCFRSAVRLVSAAFARRQRQHCAKKRPSRALTRVLPSNSEERKGRKQRVHSRVGTLIFMVGFLGVFGKFGVNLKTAHVAKVSLSSLLASSQDESAQDESCESYKKLLQRSILDSAKVPTLQPKRLEIWIEWDRFVEGLYELDGTE
ncbi:hypothetical protein BC937DRAFT_89314, partial [Endogone sp. FLAS-F59071]